MACSKYHRVVMMGRLEKIGAFSFAKLLMVVFGLIGLLFGVYYAFGGLLIDIMVSLDWLSAEKMETSGLSNGTLLAFGALLAMPLIGMAFGFFSGLLGAWFYNVFAKKLGGLNVDFKFKNEGNRSY